MAMTWYNICRSVPEGVFDLRNSTEAQQLIAARGGVVDANYLISWFCSFSHEVFGGTFVLPGAYLWAVAASLPLKSSLPRCLAPVFERCRDGAVIACAGVILSTCAVVKGALGFAQHTATTRLLLQWNGLLGVWSWAPGDHNPDGLFGVFLSSGVWIMVGVLLLLWRDNRWFLVLQLVSLVGQGLGGALGRDLVLLPSNFFEQVVTWALIVLGRQLSRDVSSTMGVATPLLNHGPK